MLLETRTVEKPWGKDLLPPPFATPPGKRIGEIWFEPPADLPQLLVKYLFTSEKLSVQVHPSDAQTLAGGLNQISPMRLPSGVANGAGSRSLPQGFSTVRVSSSMPA